MARPRKDYDYKQARILWDAEVSENMISKELKIPRWTLQRHRAEWMTKKGE
jgi:hypothetical protein